MANYNLFAAVFWLVVGVGILATTWAPNAMPLNMAYAGWTAIVLAAYNLLRWTLGRLTRRPPSPATRWPSQRTNRRTDRSPPPDENIHLPQPWPPDK